MPIGTLYKYRVNETISDNELKRIYILAAIDAYGLTHLSAYTNRTHDVVVNAEGATLCGFLFIPKYIMENYVKQNRQN